MKSPNRIYALIGGTIWGNRGAEAMTCAAIARIREREPGARFHHISYYPHADARLIADASHVEVIDGRPQTLVFLIFPAALLVGLFRLLGISWPMTWMPKAARKLREADALLDVQGISFDDGRLVFLPYKVLSVLPAVLMGVPVFKLSQAMGPFKQWTNRIAAKLILPYCRLVFARGDVTADALKRIGLSGSQFGLAPDLAFSFEAGDSLSREGTEHVASLCERMAALRASGIQVAALAPSTVVWAKMTKRNLDYVDLLAKIVIELRRLGMAVLIFPNACRREVDSPRNNDFIVMDALASHLRSLNGEDENTLFVEHNVNFDGILQLLGEADLLLASRFHGMVAGLSQSVPTMVIGWSHKYAEVLRQFDIEEMATNYAQAFDDTPGLLKRLIEQRKFVAEAISRNLPRIRAESQGQFDRVVEVLP